jgi:hypothetical protein
MRLGASRAPSLSHFTGLEKECDYAITVACKVPENVLQEDQKLLMRYDRALTRKEDAQ